ncbi:hypothetical protein ACFLRM_01060 [Acidobacteriota bacterium]
MKNKIMLSLILLIFVSGYTPLHAQGFILQKDVFVGEDDVQDTVMTLGGSIHIKGKVRECAIAFGGTIVVEGQVGDCVVGFGSEITLKSSAIIDGDVVSIGGTLTKEPGVIIEGDTVNFGLNTSKEVKEFLRDGLLGIFGISLLPLFIIIKLTTMFIWFIIALGLIVLFPQQIPFASSQIRKSFWPIFGTGLLSMLIFVGLIIFSALLSIILIGIPILLSLIIIGITLKIFGQVVLFYFFGESLSNAFGWKKATPILVVIIGFLFVSLIGLIPIIGSLFSSVLSIIGWGVVIRTKFGTTENWFNRQSAKPAEESK